jgi:hypothetical protein
MCEGSLQTHNTRFARHSNERESPISFCLVGATGIEPVTPSMSILMSGLIFGHLRQQTTADAYLSIQLTSTRALPVPCQLAGDLMGSFGLQTACRNARIGCLSVNQIYPSQSPATPRQLFEADWGAESPASASGQKAR